MKMELPKSPVKPAPKKVTKPKPGQAALFFKGMPEDELFHT